jgi:hypothetical protein
MSDTNSRARHIDWRSEMGESKGHGHHRRGDPRRPPGARVRSFVQPRVLFRLAQKPAHGYELLEQSAARSLELYHPRPSPTTTSTPTATTMPWWNPRPTGMPNRTIGAPRTQRRFSPQLTTGMISQCRANCSSCRRSSTPAALRLYPHPRILQPPGKQRPCACRGTRFPAAQPA